MNRQNQPAPDQPSRNQERQRGSIVVYLAIALVTFGVLAMAGGTRFGASILGVSAPNCAVQARFMAESGVRYATARLRSAAVTNQATLTTMIATLNGQTYTVNAALNQSFSLTVTASGTGAAMVSATGRACGGVTATTSPVSSASVNVPAAGVGPPAPDDFSFDPTRYTVNPGVGSSGGATVGPGTITLGNALYSSSASVWYTGSGTTCTPGNCTLGNGMCSYFEFQFTSASTGDGFVWTVMSGDTNTNASNGGNTGMGELLGYGGLGSSGLGIQPPKFGVEFDIWNNGCGGNACVVNSRCDSTVADHVAFLFWGSQTLAGCPTFDDNRHTAPLPAAAPYAVGNASEPVNSYSFDAAGDGWDGYYYRPGGGNAWLKGGGSFLFRYELDRSTTANAQGNYIYTERAWLKKAADAHAATMHNCSATDTDAPTLSRAFALNAATHQKLNAVFFGWTEGTGGATQIATLSNPNIAFKAAPTAPTTPIVPQDYVAGWTMYEGVGTTLHDANATNHNDGTLAGSVMWTPDVRATNSASLFFHPSASSGRVTVPDSASLDLSATGSIACWIKIRSTPDWGGLVHKGVLANFSDETYSFQFVGSRQLGLYINDGGAARTVTSAALPNNNQWYHVATTWDAATLKIYINGTLSSTANNNGSKEADINTAAVIIGAQLPVSSFYTFPGIMDDIFIYNRALTAAEIANMALGHP